MPRYARRAAAVNEAPGATSSKLGESVGFEVDKGVLPGSRSGVMTVCAAMLTIASPAAAGSFAKGPYLQGLGSEGVTVRVELSSREPATVEVAAASGAPRKVVSDAAVFHSVRVDGLSPASTYTYEVTAAGVTESGRFTTAPADDRPFRFIVYGDNRSDAAAHAAVVRAIEGSPSDFLVNTGDMVANGEDAGQWRAFFEIEHALLRDRCLFAAVGNHELTEGSAVSFVRFFAPPREAGGPGLYGSFRWSSTRFFLLNAMDEWTGEEEAWLRDVLVRADDEPGLRHRIAVLHHGPFSSGPHGPNPRLPAGDVVGLLAGHHVDLLLAGHDHVYERGQGHGLKYVISGGGGAPLYPRKTHAPETLAFESVHHFVDVTVDADAVRLVAVRASGSVIERCGFRSGGPWECSESNPAAAATATPEARAGDPAPSPPSRSCACDLPASSSGPGGWPALLLVASASLIAQGRGRYPRAMLRRLRLVPLLVLLGASVLGALGAPSCATYKDDLNRATDHYNRNQFEPALALLRVLEDDMDSFSPAEQAQYAYVRGMTDYRLSSLAPQGTGVADPRRGYRDNARHWLAVAASIDKKTPGGLTPEEKGRVTDALTDLNRDVFGGAEAIAADADAGVEAGATPPAVEPPAEKPAP